MVKHNDIMGVLKIQTPRRSNEQVDITFGRGAGWSKTSFGQRVSPHRRYREVTSHSSHALFQDSSFTLRLVHSPRPLDNFPSAAELFSCFLERTSLQYPLSLPARRCLITADISELLKFLRFDTRGALPVGGMSHHKVKWPSTGGFKLGW